VPQSEDTPIAPITPYGAGKAFAHFLTGAFRRHYGVHASSAILFNHESPRRPEQFLTRKVSRGAAAISLGLEQSSGSATSPHNVTGASPATTCGRCG
jgi:GDPmannose 4,6-dehydratase